MAFDRMRNEEFNGENTWDVIAYSFDKTRRKPWKKCMEFIETLSSSMTVVDLCCGNGRHLLPCAKQVKRVIGVDFSNNLLRIVQTKARDMNIRNVDLIHSDVRFLPLTSGTIDAALYIASLHNIPGRTQRVQSLKEMNRVLKKHGTGLISVWSRWQDKYRKEFFKKWFKQGWKEEFGDITIFWRQHGFNIPRFYHLYSKKEFINDLRMAGFEIIEVDAVKIHSRKHPDNYFAVVKKE